MARVRRERLAHVPVGSDQEDKAGQREKLVKTRGKDFRHEKTKKKRGGYKGGIIDMGSNSIKFE